jgi:hypothetical protein
MAELEKVLSSEELAEYQAFKAEKAQRERLEKAKEDRLAYKTLVSEAVESAFPFLKKMSEELTAEKKAVMNTFADVLKLKSEIFPARSENLSHNFISIDGTKRIIIGQYVTDNYHDSVEDGIAMIWRVIESFAKDDESRVLVNAIRRLLSRDKEGNLKASRVLQLRKMADELDNGDFMEGVRVIEEAYIPNISKTYIRAEYKNETGKWVAVPLGMTEV